MAADPTPGVTKTMAALLAGAVCVVVGNVLNHVDLSAFPNGWSLWTFSALKQSDSMSAMQTIVTTAIVYFAPHGGANGGT